jgi:hypothetical protein
MHSNIKGDNRHSEEKGKIPKLVDQGVPPGGPPQRNILKKLSYS